MEENLLNSNMPQEGTPEYEQMMREAYGEEFQYQKRATFLTRFWAFLIDAIIIICLQQGIYYFIYQGDTSIGSFGFSFSQDSEIQQLLQSRLLQIGFVISACFTLMEVFLASSPGKMIMKLQIGNFDSNLASTNQLIIRSAYKNLSTILTIIFVATEMNVAPYSYLAIALSFIMIIGCFFALSEKRQAVQDIIAKTAVFKKSNLNLEN